MKRTLTMLLALILLAGALLSAAAESTSLLNWEGFELRPLYYAVRRRDDGDSTLKVYMRVINNRDRAIYLKLESANVDGVSVEGIGILNCKANTDTGENSSEYCLFTNNGSGDATLQDPRTVSMIAILQDYDNHERLHTEFITLDLSALPSEITVAPTSTPAPQASDFKTLQKGSKGDDVKRLQQRLIDLGYLNDTADGSYGPKTEAAVRDFCSQNGLPIDGTASPEMQALLFSDAARPYSEPWIPLTIGARTEWRNKNSDNFAFRTQVVNNSKTRTVKGFELEYYPTDVWGNRLLGDNITRKFTTTTTVKPGKTAYTLWAVLGASFYNADMIHMAITKIVFDDGEIREDPNPIEYTCSLH